MGEVNNFDQDITSYCVEINSVRKKNLHFQRSVFSQDYHETFKATKVSFLSNFGQNQLKFIVFPQIVYFF